MTTNTPQNYAALDAWIDQHFDEEVRFLQALVRVPTDTPPGNNAPHAERTAELLTEFGYTAEKHAVPAADVLAYFDRPGTPTAPTEANNGRLEHRAAPPSASAT